MVRICTFIQGGKNHTIVLLSGIGTLAQGFELLINESSKNNKLVVVESFGYEWNVITDNERSYIFDLHSKMEVVQKKNNTFMCPET